MYFSNIPRPAFDANDKLNQLPWDSAFRKNATAWLLVGGHYKNPYSSISQILSRRLGGTGQLEVGRASSPRFHRNGRLLRMGRLAVGRARPVGTMRPPLYCRNRRLENGRMYQPTFAGHPIGPERHWCGSGTRLTK